MKIAFIGQKGIPAIWGGIEAYVEELSTRLVKRGHSVDVYVRSWYTKKEKTSHNGVSLIHTPCISTKIFDAITHSFSSSMHCIFKNYDIIHYQAMGPSLSSWIPRVFMKKVIVTIHRLDYNSEKWGKFAKSMLRFSEKAALVIPQKTIVVGKHLREKYKKEGRETIYIPNGVNIPNKSVSKIITDEYNLKGDDYILYMGRLVPEKRCDWLIKAFMRVKRDFNKDIKLVIAGGSSSTDKYFEELKNSCNADKDIIFTGYVTGNKKEELFSNAKLFVLPSSLEGLPIATLEASSYELPCLVSDIEPHKEIIINNSNGFLFQTDSFNDLCRRLIEIVNGHEDKLNIVGREARRNAENNFNWEMVVNKIEKIYFEVLA